ncbi:MAG TPA: DUF2066 domain-containing protein [Alphaproteobacteria bacterium]|nr:DUF2066 domain-containing protein [Alphaproteobacteria bacterium]
MTLDRRKPALVWFCSLLALLFGTCLPTELRAESFLTITDVPIDVTAKSASAARDKAIADVQAKAFQRLLKRMVAKPEDLARLQPSQQQIESFVQDFAVESERTSPVRYIGRFTIRFRAGRVRQYLIDSGIQSINEVQQVLILPIYKGSGGPVLWGVSNPWRLAWEQGGSGDGPVSLILPNGDAYDKGTATPAALDSGDMGAILPLIQRYHTAGAVVVEAASRDPAKGPVSGLNLTVNSFDITGPKGSQTLGVDPASGDQPDKILRRGVGVISDALETGWQQAIAANGSIGLVGAAPPEPGQPQANPDSAADSTGTLGTLYPMSMTVSDLADWAHTRDRLAQLPGVQRLSLDAVTRSSAAFTLDFAGDPLALQSVLASNGFVLVQTAPATASAPASYELKRAPPAGAAAEGAPPAEAPLPGK